MTPPNFWSPARRLDQTNFHMVWPTYNAVLWSPDDANSGSTGDIRRRLWFKVEGPALGVEFIPPTDWNKTHLYTRTLLVTEYSVKKEK